MDIVGEFVFDISNVFPSYQMQNMATKEKGIKGSWTIMSIGRIFEEGFLIFKLHLKFLIF